MSVAWAGIPHWPGEPAAEAVGFVLPHAPLDLAPLAALLREGCRGAAVGTRGRDGRLDVVAAPAGGWMVRVYLQQGDGVLADSRAMAAGCYAEHPAPRKWPPARGGSKSWSSIRTAASPPSTASTRRASG